MKKIIIILLITLISCNKQEIVKVEKKQPIEISLESVNIVGDTSLLINYIVK